MVQLSTSIAQGKANKGVAPAAQAASAILASQRRHLQISDFGCSVLLHQSVGPLFLIWPLTL